jgi:hypothetical protein
VEFWPLVDWLPYSPDLKSLDFSVCSILQAKSQATPHTNLDSLHPSIAVEWDWFAAEYIHKTCCSFRPRRQTVVQKNEVEIE